MRFRIDFIPPEQRQRASRPLGIFRIPHTARKWSGRYIHEKGPGRDVYYIDSGIIQSRKQDFTRFYVEPNPSRNPRANSFSGCVNHPNRLGASFSSGSYVSVRGRFVGRSSCPTSSSSSDSSSSRPRFVPTLTAAGELSVTAVVCAEWLLEPSPRGVGDDLAAEICEWVLDVEGGGTRGFRNVDPCGVIGAGVILLSYIRLKPANYKKALTVYISPCVAPI